MLMNVLNASLFVLSFVLPLVIFLPPRDGKSLLAAVLAFMLGLVPALTNSCPRPQTLAIFCFSIFVLILGSRQKPGLFKRILCGFPLLVLWQNLHPSVVLLLPLLLAEACRDLASRRINYGQGCPLTFSRTFRATILDLLGPTLLILVASLCTPEGVQIYSFSINNTTVSRTWLGVSEWLPPWHERVNEAMVGFWFSLGLLVLLVIRVKQKIDPSLLLPCIIFLPAVLYSARFAVFWGVLVVAPFYCVLSLLFKESQESLRTIATFKYVSLRNGMFVAVILLVVINCLSWMKPDYLFPTDLPIREVAQLHKFLPQGRVVNYREWAGLVHWVSHGQQQTLIDGRLYLFSKEDWNYYDQMALGLIPLEEIENSFHPDAFLLHLGYHKNLIEMLDRSSNWRRLISWKEGVIFVSSLQGEISKK